MRLRAHPVTLSAFALAALLSDAGTLACLICALCCHEQAHLFAARAAGASVEEILLTPFGGAMRLNRLWLMPPRRLMFVALAGPAANLLLSAAGIALIWARPAWAGRAEAFIAANVSMCLVNLLPALPLDGGHTLFAALRFFWPVSRALRACAWSSRLVALGLASLGAAQAVAAGRINLSPFLLTGYILYFSRAEQKKAGETAARALLMMEPRSGSPVPVRFWAARDGDSAAALVRAFRPEEINITLPTREDGSIAGMISQRDALKMASMDEKLRVSDPSAPRIKPE